MNAFERETIVRTSDGEDVVTIWTAQRRHINRLRKHPKATETGNGFHERTEWATFEVPADQWSPVGIKRSVSLSSEQRDFARARLAAAREGLS